MTEHEMNKIIREKSLVKWSREEAIIEVATNAFGEILFAEFNQEAKVKNKKKLQR